MVNLRERAAASCRILSAEGHEHLGLGHVSVRERPDSLRFWVKPAGLGLDEVGANDLVLLDEAGRPVHADVSIHQEMAIHAEIYKARQDVQCVVHTHPFYTAALAATSATIRMLSQDSVRFANGIGTYASAALITSRSQGRALAEALGFNEVVVLRNHGLVTVGEDVEGATVAAVAFERSIKLQATATLLGSLQEIQPAEVEALRAYFAAEGSQRAVRMFEYLLRRVLPRTSDSVRGQ